MKEKIILFNSIFVTAMLGSSVYAQPPVSGGGTVDRIPKWTATNTIENSVIYENSGNIGIGMVPGYKLDISADNNLNGSTLHYRIAGTPVLWKNASSTFVGENAGLNALTATNGTFVGYNAGASASTNSGNGDTAIGSNVGASIVGGGANLLFGYQAGYSVPMEVITSQ